MTCDKWPLSVVGAIEVVLLNLEEFWEAWCGPLGLAHDDVSNGRPLDRASTPRKGQSRLTARVQVWWPLNQSLSILIIMDHGILFSSFYIPMGHDSVWKKKRKGKWIMLVAKAIPDEVVGIPHVGAVEQLTNWNIDTSTFLDWLKRDETKTWRL